MSRITVPMYVSMTEEYYQEFLEKLEEKGFVSIPFETSEGIISVMLTKINYEV